MALINHRTHEIHFKIVYYGPGLCGKTTNLKSLHDRLPPERRGKMISIATDQERTLFFDFLPIDLGTVNGFLTRFHLYTVPGQVYYRLSRRAVLQGVDGLVFVADSHPAREAANRESLADLNDHLRTLGITGPALARIPWVFQWNKRDHAVTIPVERLQRTLNAQGWPEFEAVASEGKGVSETLRAACKAVLARLATPAAPGAAATPATASPAATAPSAPATPSAPAPSPAAAFGATHVVSGAPAVAAAASPAATPAAATASPAATTPAARATRSTTTTPRVAARTSAPARGSASTRGPATGRGPATARPAATTPRPAAKPMVTPAASPGRAWPRPTHAAPAPPRPAPPRAPDAGWSPQPAQAPSVPATPATRIVSVPGAPPSIVVPNSGQPATPRASSIGVATAIQPGTTKTEPEDPSRP